MRSEWERVIRWVSRPPGMYGPLFLLLTLSISFFGVVPVLFAGIVIGYFAFLDAVREERAERGRKVVTAIRE